MRKNLGITLVVLAILISTIEAISAFNNELWFLIFTAPIYFIIYIAGAKVYRYLNFPGMFTLNVICFVRYIILPLLILLDVSYSYNTYTVRGCLLFIFEELCVGSFMMFIVKTQYKKLSTTTFSDSVKNNVSLRTGVIFIIIILVALVLIVMNPNYLDKYNFIWNTKSDNLKIYKYGEAVSGISNIIIDISKMGISVIVSGYFINKYFKYKK